MFKRFICIQLILAAVFFGFIKELEATVPVSAAGYITRAFTVTNSIGSAQTNYPVEQVISTSPEITAGRMRADCGDIRVYNTNFVTALTYAVINCNTVFTSVVFVVPSLATGTTTLYVTYGDSALVSAASPASVFDIYQMFSATAPTCTLAGSSVWDPTNQWLQLTTNTSVKTGTCNYSYLSSLATRGYKAFFQAWTGGTVAGGEATWQYAFDTSVPTQEDIVLAGAHFTVDEGGDRLCYTTSTTSNGVCTSAFTTTTLDNSTWTSYKVTWDTANRTLFQNGVLQITNTTGTAPTLTNTNFGFASRTTTVALSNEHRVRQAAVMKFSNSVTVSALGANSGPVDSNMGFVIRDSTDTTNINVCDLGTVVTTVIATCAYRLKVTTNARLGYTVFAKTDAGFDLPNGTEVTNALAGPTGSTLVAGTELYGITLTPGTCTNGIVTPNTLFTTAATGVLFKYVAGQAVLACNGPNVPILTDTVNTSLVTHTLAISGNTPAGDYTQAVTWTVSPNY